MSMRKRQKDIKQDREADQKNASIFGFMRPETDPPTTQNTSNPFKTGKGGVKGQQSIFPNIGGLTLSTHGQSFFNSSEPFAGFGSNSLFGNLNEDAHKKSSNDQLNRAFAPLVKDQITEPKKPDDSNPMHKTESISMPPWNLAADPKPRSANQTNPFLDPSNRSQQQQKQPVNRQSQKTIPLSDAFKPQEQQKTLPRQEIMTKKLPTMDNTKTVKNTLTAYQSTVAEKPQLQQDQSLPYHERLLACIQFDLSESSIEWIKAKHMNNQLKRERMTEQQQQIKEMLLAQKRVTLMPQLEIYKDKQKQRVQQQAQFYTKKAEQLFFEFEGLVAVLENKQRKLEDYQKKIVQAQKKDRILVNKQGSADQKADSLYHQYLMSLENIMIPKNLVEASAAYSSFNEKKQNLKDQVETIKQELSSKMETVNQLEAELVKVQNEIMFDQATFPKQSLKQLNKKQSERAKLCEEYEVLKHNYKQYKRTKQSQSSQQRGSLSNSILRFSAF